MNIIKPYAKIVGPTNGIDLLRFCELAARISHRSEDKQTLDSYERFLRFVCLEKGDLSVIEHCCVTVEAYVDRGITHEIVRHRLGSYTQESTRFVNYEKKMPPSFVVPLGLEMNSLAYSAWESSIQECEISYKNMITAGVSPQIARSVFPNALASKIWITYNLRQWRHFFLMRTSREAHPQMRQVTIPLLEEFQIAIPILYEDIQPGATQVENMRKLR